MLSCQRQSRRYPQPPERTDLVHRPLAATAADAHAVDDVALLGLVAHAAGLVGARGARQAHDAGHLAELPAPDAQEEAEHIALLLPPQLLNVLRESEEAKGVGVPPFVPAPP